MNKEALEQLNAKIDQQVNLQNNLEYHTEEYRNSLQEEIKLQEEKLDLLKQWVR